MNIFNLHDYIMEDTISKITVKQYLKFQAHVHIFSGSQLNWSHDPWSRPSLAAVFSLVLVALERYLFDIRLYKTLNWKKLNQLKYKTCHTSTPHLSPAD